MSVRSEIEGDILSAALGATKFDHFDWEKYKSQQLYIDLAMEIGYFSSTGDGTLSTTASGFILLNVPGRAMFRDKDNEKRRCIYLGL
jgi:hypothetical protein